MKISKLRLFNNEDEKISFINSFNEIMNYIMRFCYTLELNIDLNEDFIKLINIIDDSGGRRRHYSLNNNIAVCTNDFDIECFKNGKPHRDGDFPQAILADTTFIYCKNGLDHRDCGPSTFKTNKSLRYKNTYHAGYNDYYHLHGILYDKRTFFLIIL